MGLTSEATTIDYSDIHDCWPFLRNIIAKIRKPHPELNSVELNKLKFMQISYSTSVPQLDYSLCVIPDSYTHGTYSGELLRIIIDLIIAGRSDEKFDYIVKLIS